MNVVEPLYLSSLELELPTSILLMKLISCLIHSHDFGLPLSTEQQNDLSLLGVVQKYKRGSRKDFAIDLS